MSSRANRVIYADMPFLITCSPLGGFHVIKLLPTGKEFFLTSTRSEKAARDIISHLLSIQLIEFTDAKGNYSDE